MTRISARLLVQRVDDDIVIVDEGSGEEVLVPAEDVGRLLSALHQLALS